MTRCQSISTDFRAIHMIETFLNSVQQLLIMSLYDDDQFTADIHFSDDEEVPNAFSSMVPSQKNLGVHRNRQNFLRSAPSMMKLMQWAQNEATKAPIDSPQSKHATPSTPKSPPVRHGKSGSVVDDLLAADIAALESEENDMDMRLLAMQAIEEFQILAQQYDALYKEKEMFSQKIFEINRQYMSLLQQLASMEQFKVRIQNLETQNKQLQKQLQDQNVNNGQTNVSNTTNAENFVVLRQQINELIEEKESLIQQLKSSSNSSNSEEVQALQQKIVYLKNEMEQQTNEHQSYLLEIEQKTNQIAGLQSKVSELETKLNESESQTLQAQIESLLAEKAESRSEIERLKNELDQVSADKSDSEALLAQIATLTEKDTLSQSKLSQLQSQLDEAQKETERVTSNLQQQTLHAQQQLDKQKETFLKQMEALKKESENNDSESDLELNENALPDIDSQVEKDELIEKLKNEIKELKESLALKENEENDSIQKLMELTEMSETNNILLKNQLEEEDEFEEVEEEIEVEIEESEEEVDVVKISEENEQLRMHVEEMTTLVENIHKEKVEHKKSVKQLNLDKEVLNGKVEGLEKELAERNQV